MPSQKKTRLDALLVQKGLAPTRAKAQALILRGDVLVKDVPVTKAGHGVDPDDEVRVRHKVGDEYVSRGALKLLGALDAFGVSPSGQVALDVGASTGGFTQVLLERGASAVIALDVGHGQLDWKIRSDPRVLVLEHINARTADLTHHLAGRVPTLVTVDVSFISLLLIFPNLLRHCSAVSDWITLIKPQFEVGAERVGKGGIVRDAAARAAAVEEVTRGLEHLGLVRIALVESPISGTQGNLEYLAHWRRADRRGLLDGS